jgi:hypothetical protein
MRLSLCVIALAFATSAGAQTPPAGGGRAAGNQGRRRPIEVMTLTTKAWEDGGRIPQNMLSRDAMCRRRYRGRQLLKAQRASC